MKFYLPVLLVALVAVTRRVDGITYQENRYELNIALSEYALDVPADDRNQFLQNFKGILTEASRFLFEVTDYRMYFGTINILIPRSWARDVSDITTPTAAFSYATADVRVEETKTDLDPPSVIEQMRTKNPKPCGQPGDHIIVPPQFVNNTDNWSEKYGDRVKTFIHEFARFRYGVFEEYGYMPEPNQTFTYGFKNVRGHLQVTGCNNTEIKGYVHRRTNTSDTNCTLNEPSCIFSPFLNATDGPTTSLMFMHFLPTTNKFCDDSNHDKTASNRQNHFCRNRSVKSVIETSKEFTRLNALPSTTNTDPDFRIHIAAGQAVYVVFDVSTHDTPSDAQFAAARSQVVTDLINQLGSQSNRVMMGVATIGETFVERQKPIPVQGNENSLKVTVESITRNGTKLNLEQGMLEVGKKLAPFAHLSGSTVLLFKFNSRTDISRNIEAEVTAVFNTRSARIVTLELLKTAMDQMSLKRTTLLTSGQYFSATAQEYSTVLNSAISLTVNFARELRFENRRIPLVLRKVSVTPGIPFKSWVRNDFAAKLEVNFYVDKSVVQSSYQIKVRDYDFASNQHEQTYQSWDGNYRIHTFQFEWTSTTNHSYEITSNIPVDVHVEGAEILSGDAPLHLGGGGVPRSKPVEVEITTSGDNGQLNMGIASADDLSFLVYVAIKKGASSAGRTSLGKALIHGPSGSTTEITVNDDGKYPDVVAGDGIYSGLFVPEANNTPTTYYISARMQGNANTDSISRSLPINQENYCCDSTTPFYQRYVPYAASLQVIGAAVFKQRPVRITDFTLIENSNDTVTLKWTAPAASYGSNDKVDSYKIAYGEDSTTVIDARGLLSPKAILIDEASLVNGTLQPLAPGEEQRIQVRLSRRSLSPAPLYFSIASVKNGNIESHPAPIVYTVGVPGVTTAAPFTTQSTSTSTTTTTTTTTPSTTTSAATNAATTSPTTPTTPTTSTSTPSTKKPNVASLKSASYVTIFSAIVFLCAIFQAVV